MTDRVLRATAPGAFGDDAGLVTGQNMVAGWAAGVTLRAMQQSTCAVKGEAIDFDATHSSYTWSCRRSSRSSAAFPSRFPPCCPNLISPFMRNSASGRELHQAERSSWFMMGPRLSDASGVAGDDGEGDREHAVVEEDDMGNQEGEREVRKRDWCRSSLVHAPVVLSDSAPRELSP